MNTLESAKQAFLSEVALRTPEAYRAVAFASILDDLLTWTAGRANLIPRRPKDQHTVSCGLRAYDTVLWAAYPRRRDGAKVVVLPKLFRRLPADQQMDLLARLHAIAPRVSIAANGLLQLPMHVLATERTMQLFMDLLDTALGYAVKYRARQP